MPDTTRLLALMQEARALLAQPDNDFSWSSWVDADDALAEIDAILATLALGRVPSFSVLFVPTGPMQEVALASGWGNEFIDLADRVDAARDALRSPDGGRA